MNCSPELLLLFVMLTEGVEDFFSWGSLKMSICLLMIPSSCFAYLCPLSSLRSSFLFFAFFLSKEVDLEFSLLDFPLDFSLLSRLSGDLLRLEMDLSLGGDFCRPSLSAMISSSSFTFSSSFLIAHFWQSMMLKRLSLSGSRSGSFGGEQT